MSCVCFHLERSDSDQGAAGAAEGLQAWVVTSQSAPGQDRPAVVCLMRRSTHTYIYMDKVEQNVPN